MFFEIRRYNGYPGKIRQSMGLKWACLVLFGWLISGFMNQDYWILEETPFAEESIRDDLTDPILMQKVLVFYYISGNCRIPPYRSVWGLLLENIKQSLSELNNWNQNPVMRPQRQIPPKLWSLSFHCQKKHQILKRLMNMTIVYAGKGVDLPGGNAWTTKLFLLSKSHRKVVTRRDHSITLFLRKRILLKN